MNGEDVFGSKIRVIYSSHMEFTNSQGQIKVNSSKPLPQVPLQQSVSVASLPGTSSYTSVWKPTWAQLPVTSMSDFNLVQKPLETVQPTASHSASSNSHCGSASSITGSGSTSRDSSREPSPDAAGPTLTSTTSATTVAIAPVSHSSLINYLIIFCNSSIN